MNQLQTTDQNKVYFQLHKGSNYKVLMTYETIEIIEYDQFVKLAQVLNDPDYLFVTINDRMRNKTTIIDISPTNELTRGQAKVAESKAFEAKKQQDRKDELERIKRSFDAEFYNVKYGNDGWLQYSFKKTDKHLIDSQDIKESWEAFKKKYPKESAEIEKLS